MTDSSPRTESSVPGSSGAAGGVRRSDRVPLELKIQVSGSDGLGQSFMEDSRTVVVSRHGAKILLRHIFAPDQEVTVRCHLTRKEADARIVGQIGRSSLGYYYGIEFLNPDADLWGIDFPPLAESEKGVARALLECAHCHTQELIYLNEFEAEVFEANRTLSRRCKRCADSTLWKQSTIMLAEAEASGKGVSPPFSDPAPDSKSAGSNAARTENERKDLRVSLKMVACIRGMECGEEVVTTENISRGGLRFKSGRHYSPGSNVEVAVPYAHGATNIFAPAQIVHAEYLAAEKLTLFGLEYAQVHKGWKES